MADKVVASVPDVSASDGQPSMPEM